MTKNKGKKQQQKAVIKDNGKKQQPEMAIRSNGQVYQLKTLSQNIN